MKASKINARNKLPFDLLAKSQTPFQESLSLHLSLLSNAKNSGKLECKNRCEAELISLRPLRLFFAIFAVKSF